MLIYPYFACVAIWSLVITSYQSIRCWIDIIQKQKEVAIDWRIDPEIVGRVSFPNQSLLNNNVLFILFNVFLCNLVYLYETIWKGSASCLDTLYWRLNHHLFSYTIRSCNQFLWLRLSMSHNLNELKVQSEMLTICTKSNGRRLHWTGFLNEVKHQMIFMSLLIFIFIIIC